MSTFPTKDAILAFVRDNPGASGKREIARAFGLKGGDRLIHKALLREMEGDGTLARDRKAFRDRTMLPPVAVLVVEGPDADGDVFARPQEWDGDAPAPRLFCVHRAGDPALGKGDRILARTLETGPGQWEARLIRRLASAPDRVLGIFRVGSEGGRIVPVDRRAPTEWMVPAGETAGARDGELVEGEALAGPRFGLPRARIADRLGDPAAPRAVSLIAVHQHGLPVEFPAAALAEAEAAAPVARGDREDLRHLPLITIDPSDARDHDDAVCALPDPDLPDGWIVWVAIADVAHYVRPGSALDREARLRGNSTYFPDRVVPMLPEALSGDLCSLHEGVDRPCIAVEMRLSPDGSKRAHRFTRGLMRSPASLTYEQAQAADDGNPDAVTAPLVAPVLAPLFAAWRCAMQARARREPLDLELPERKIILSDTGEVLSVAFRARLDAHKLIEEFMILANVAAAEALEAKRRPLLYRVHEEPSAQKVEALAEIAEGCGLSFPKGAVLRTALFNRLLAQAAHTDFAEMLNLSVLRSQTQAYYAPQNFGHFGLALRSYAHFTSPIRRYADLVVHRALIAAHGWGSDGLHPDDAAVLEETGKHISMTERRSMEAERDTNDRYLAAFLADRVGTSFAGKVSGVAKFGLFVRLAETGADGLIPISTLGREYFRHDPATQTLTGEQTGRVIGLGMPVQVRLAEAVPVTGGLIFELLEVEGRATPRAQAPKGKAAPRLLARAKVRARKVAAKEQRRR